LNGTKTWITNSPHAHVLLVWAKLNGEEIRGFLVEREKIQSGTLFTPKIEGKLSLRASTTGQIVMEDVRVNMKDALLPKVKGLKGPFSCLNKGLCLYLYGI
jgi:glutaryl-CoA dehydrogenase